MCACCGDLLAPQHHTQVTPELLAQAYQVHHVELAGLGLVGEFMGGILQSFRSARSRLTDHFLSEYGFSLLTILAAQFSIKASLGRQQ